MHTERVRAVLEQAAELRARAAEISKGIADRRWGMNGYVNADNDVSALVRQADTLEASVVIKVKTLPGFEFRLSDCMRAKVAADRQRTLNNPATPQKLREALAAIIEMERGPYRSAIRPYGL